MQKKVSVIMSVYNESVDFLKKSVGSIINQTYLNVEFIIILDNPDNRKAKEYLLEVSELYSNIVFYQNKENLGLVRSLNKALELSTGEYIARMDADDISDLKRIEKQVHFLNKNNLDLVGCNTEDIDLYNKVIKQVVYPQNNKDIIDFLRYASAMAHPTWLAKKDVYKTLGGYREIEACEDYDFLVRAALNNIKMGVLQEYLFMYRINSDGISSTKKVVQKSNMRYIRKYYKTGKSFSMEEYEKSLEGREYKRLYRSISRYYYLRNKQKNKKNNRGMYILYGVCIALVSPIARENIRDCICMKQIMKRV